MISGPNYRKLFIYTRTDFVNKKLVSPTGNFRVLLLHSYTQLQVNYTKVVHKQGCGDGVGGFWVESDS